VVIEPLRGPLLRDHAKREHMQQVAEWLQRWWPERPQRFLLAAGNLSSMLYNLFPVRGLPEPHDRPWARTYPPAVREQARRDGVRSFVLPDVGRRMAPGEHVSSTPGLAPLAGAQVNPCPTSNAPRAVPERRPPGARDGPAERARRSPRRGFRTRPRQSR